MAELPILEQRFRMPNITVGKAFKEKIQAVGDLNGELELCSTQIDSALEGLSINDNTFMAEGSVNKSGDYTIELYCYLLLASGEKQKVKGMLKVSVIPDPHSLWKNLPSDHNAPFHKSDSASDSCKTDSAHFIAASVRGRSHAHKGIHREDDITIHCSSSQWSIMAIADGAGSCQYSRRGSELATLCATETLKETLNDHYGSDLEKIITESLIEKSDDKKAIKIKQTLGNIYQQTMVKAVHNVALAIQEEVNILNDTGDQKKDNNPICFKDFSTTLLLVAYKPVSDGYLIFSFWVGDGVAVIYDKGKSVTLLGEPDSGEYAGQTRFLDYKLFEDSHIYNRIRIQKVSSMTALILATDGISDAKFDTEKQLSSVEQWDVLWNELEPIVNNNDLKQGEKNLLKWMEFWSVGNHDDRSMAICFIEK